MKFYWFFLFFLISILSVAQQKFEYNYEQYPLDSVLHDIEVRNGVNFSFAKDQVQNKKISLDSEKLTLKELLKVFEAQTGLVFKAISKNQIIVLPSLPNSSICGYLLDKITRTPIAYATVLINGDIIGTTDKAGFFSLKEIAQNDYRLTIDGYEPEQIIGSKICSSIYLTPFGEQLDEVVVTGYTTTGVDRRKDGSFDVTLKSLGILPGLPTPDILQSIQMIPGITSLDESVSGIQFRGGSPDQNLILFENIKMYGSSYFYGMLSSFSPYSTGKATIFRSGASAEYGDRISGVIDISLENDIPKKTNLGLGLDGLSIDAYIKTPISDKVAVLFFARRSYTDLLKSATYDGYAEKIFNNTGEVKDINSNILDIDSDYEYTSDKSNHDFFFQDFASKIIYTPSENDQIAFSGLFADSSTDFSFFDGEETKVDSLTTKNNGLSLKWDHNGTDNRKITLKTYLSNYRSYYNNQEILTGQSLEEINIRGNTITDFGAVLTSDYQISEAKAFSVGYELSNTHVEVELSKEKPNFPEDGYSFPSSEKNFINAIFGEYTQSIKQTGMFRTGLRIVHYDNVGIILLEPRLTIRYPLTKSLSANASFEMRNQSISQLIEFNYTELRLENNIWQLSDNSEYPLLGSQQISGGLLFDNNGLTIDLEAYYKKIDGLTSFSNEFNTPGLIFSEGTSTVKGVDFLVKKKFQNFRVWLGYSYNDIQFDFPSIQLTKFSGNNDITHNLRLSNSLKTKKFQFSLGWQIRSGKPFTPIKSFDSTSSMVEFESINSSRLPIYHRMDASVLYDIELDKAKKYRMQLGISGLNLYNREVPISITYRTQTEGEDLMLDQVIQHFSLGFTPNIVLRAFF